MNKEEKIKARIERLKSQSDFYKWKYRQCSTYLIGISAILIALVSSKVGDNLLFRGLVILLFFISYFFIKGLSKESTYNIKKLSREIETNYDQLEEN